MSAKAFGFTANVFKIIPSVYTLNNGNSTVSKIPLFTGYPIDPWATIGSLSSAYPQAIVKDSSGNVYTANSGNGTISKITAAGVVTDPWATLAIGASPYGIAIDSSGNVYTTNSDSTVSKITAAGVVTDSWAKLRINTNSTAIAIDSSGNVYTANFLNSTVSKITPSGTCLLYTSDAADE